jgi:hypothetical protein
VLCDSQHQPVRLAASAVVGVVGQADNIRT